MFIRPKILLLGGETKYVPRVSLKGTIGAYKRDYTKNNCQDSNKTFDEEDSINT